MFPCLIGATQRTRFAKLCGQLGCRVRGALRSTDQTGCLERTDGLDPGPAGFMGQRQGFARCGQLSLPKLQIGGPRARSLRDHVQN